MADYEKSNSLQANWKKVTTTCNQTNSIKISPAKLKKNNDDLIHSFLFSQIATPEI